MRQILTPSTTGIEIYQDDVFNCTNGIKEHLKIMQMTFDKIREHRRVFKRSKAKLNYHRIKCLGHLITARGRVVDTGLIQAVLDFKPPKTKQHVQVFLGMANYNRDNIPRITDMTGVLQELTLKDVNIPEVWRDDVHGAAFRRLKQAFIKAPILQLPDFTKPFRVEVNGCTTHGRGVGAVLMQPDSTASEDIVQEVNKESEPEPEDQKKERMKQIRWKPVAYFSKMRRKHCLMR